ncbi:MAG: nitroreductase family protein [Herpetosiphonaceae bacterium]|nr:nitroreductase family protein [Herpetosiphonaceae bacterium]
MDLATVDELLTTTRSVRKRLDLTRPVEPAVIERCIDIAIQAPTGSNSQGWHFLVVTEPEMRTKIAALYRESFMLYAKESGRQAAPGDEGRRAQQARVADSAVYLANHMHEVPVLLLPCIVGRVENAGVMAQAGLYGSILPAAWSLMLALRARGLGSAWTTLHLRYEQEAAAILGIPPTVTQTALLPIAYVKGTDFKPATRVPGRAVTSWNRWGERRAPEAAG